MDEIKKATPQQVKAYFEDGGAKVGARELMALKKNEDGSPSKDYDQIAEGIGNGSLTY